MLDVTRSNLLSFVTGATQTPAPNVAQPGTLDGSSEIKKTQFDWSNFTAFDVLLTAGRISVMVYTYAEKRFVPMTMKHQAHCVTLCAQSKMDKTVKYCLVSTTTFPHRCASPAAVMKSVSAPAPPGRARSKADLEWRDATQAQTALNFDSFSLDSGLGSTSTDASQVSTRPLWWCVNPPFWQR